MRPVAGAGLGSNLVGLFRESLPILSGASQPHLDPAATRSFPGSLVLVPLCLVLLVLPAAVRAARGSRRPLLFLLPLVAIVAAAAASHRLVAQEPRYLYGFYVLVPALAGASTDWFLRSGARRLGGSACALVLVAGHAGSFVAAPRQDVDRVNPFTVPSLDSLREVLAKNGIDRLYSNYWTVYRLVFETRGKIVAATLSADDVTRWLPYQEEVGRSPDAGVALLDPAGDCFGRYLEERGEPYEKGTAGRFRLFWRLPAAVLDIPRRLGTLPMPREGHRVYWLQVDAPSTIPAGARGTATVRFRNDGPCPWMASTHVGYRWNAPGSAAPPVEGEGRGYPDRPAYPGDTASATLSLLAPTSPGSYRLEFDLVHEMVAWFSSKGGATASVDVQVDSPLGKLAGAGGSGR